jgi:hypothetical protein
VPYIWFFVTWASDRVSEKTRDAKNNNINKLIT